VSRLHIFDMDGTLLRGSTASLEIAHRLGCVPELLRLEAAFAAETLDTRGFAAEIFLLWQELTPGLVAEVFAQAPWIGGIVDVLADIRSRGEHSVVVTMSPDFFASRLTALGADEVVASGFPPLPFRVAPDPARILTPADKIAVADRVRLATGLDRDSCVAYGDSGSDIPLFRELRHTMAINASDALRSLARYHYDGDDLRVAYQIARGAISPAGTQESGRP
jgi:phosphoserine phosphatase